MSWLNYHHLYYFWTVVQEGGIAAASRRLHVGRPSISAQLKTLEAAIGSPLLERRGRHLALTDTGELVHSYAEEIFQLGDELAKVVRGKGKARPTALKVGIADAMMKQAAFRWLAPVLAGPEPITLRCSEAPPLQLFAALAVHDLDLVLSDVPPTPQLDLRLNSHLIEESPVGMFAAKSLAESLAGTFPRNLDGAKFLMPARTSALRQSLEAWLERTDLRPQIVAEFEDSALMKRFGEAGLGAFPAPMNLRDDLERQYGAVCLGVMAGVTDRCYAISAMRKHGHPVVAAILEQAQGH
ncbi:MAG TPA: LysR family transcriptional regulator [Planctomycetota bacterium]|nr:LysR family transcriptional regulator [Planctomycetota bacterium]